MSTSTTPAPVPSTPRVKRGAGPRAAVGSTSARVEMMRSEALKMCRAGMSCPEIGRELGVSRNRAWQLVQEALDDLRAETMQAAHDWRMTLTLEHQASLKRAIELRDDSDPQVAAAGILRTTQVLKELGDLWGAHAPKKLAATNPDGSPANSVPQVVFVPVPMGANDWEARAAIVLEQGEAAALALTNEGAANGGATEASASPRA